VTLLTFHTSFNPFSSLLSSYRPQNLVPLKCYDDPEVYDSEASPGVLPPPRHLENATLFMLVRNSEVEGAVQSIRELEDRFNRKYHYPWVFLNEQPFSEEFKQFVSTSHYFLFNVCVLTPCATCIQVACRLLPRGNCTLDKSPGSIGFSLPGSTRQRLRRRESK